MKFRHHKMVDRGTNGWVLILTLAKTEYRLYLYWRNRNPHLPAPFEFQRRRKATDWLGYSVGHWPNRI